MDKRTTSLMLNTIDKRIEVMTDTLWLYVVKSEMEGLRTLNEQCDGLDISKIEEISSHISLDLNELEKVFKGEE